MKFSVVDDSWTEITKEADPDEQFSKDSIHTSHDILGITLVPKGINDCYQLDSEFDLYPDTDYYLVYGIYDTGDSFSSEEGVLAVIQLYLTKEYAERCAMILKEHNELWRERWSDDALIKKKRQDLRKKDKYADQHVKIQLESGKYLLYGIPWHGHFEHLYYIEVKKVRLM